MPGAGEGPPALSRTQLIARLAIVNIAVAVAVTGLKYAAYASTPSVALYSDALESLINVITAVATLLAVRIAHQPADRRHPFGHHKAEYFSTALEGALILGAAFLILHEAYTALYTPPVLTAPTVGLALNFAAAVLNGAWAWLLISRARLWRSPALAADGWHAMTDVATSVAVLAGLLLALATGWTLLDPLLAALVALNVLWAGWRITMQSVGGLMDEAVTTEIMQQIRRVIATSAHGAIEVHDLRTRIAGAVTFIEFHLVVPGGMAVSEAHEICDRIEAALAEAVNGAEILIHVEPEGEAKGAAGRRGALVL